MVRPRLVEEGVPIGQAPPSDDHDMDHSSSHEMDDADHYATAFRHQQSHQFKAYSGRHATATSKPSSLLAAVGGTIPTHFKVHSKRAVIGGERPVDTSWQHQHQQQYESSNDHFGSPPFVPSPTPQYAYSNSNNNSYSIPTHQHSQHMPPPPPAPAPPRYQHHLQQQQRQHHSSQSQSHHAHHFEIGADTRVTERMQGVQDLAVKTPLIVLDGANVAYAYSQTVHVVDDNRNHNHNHYNGSSSSSSSSNIHKLEPNVTGIRVAVDYFLQVPDLRVLVVLPQVWFRSKPRGTGDAQCLTQQFHALLTDLQQAGRIVASPPLDDDDAYALTIAQRENVRAAARNGQGPGYVLSNDMFRDAQARDDSGQVREWLTRGTSDESGPGRISFAFCDMGSKDDYGDPELDIVPNPRHPLVAWIEQHRTHSV